MEYINPQRYKGDINIIYMESNKPFGNKILSRFKLLEKDCQLWIINLILA